MIPYTLNEKSITFFHNLRQHTFVNDGTKQYTNIVGAVLNNDLLKLEEYINIKKFIEKISFGKVVITQCGHVTANGRVVSDYLASRIIKHHENYGSAGITSLLNFAEKLVDNPSDDVQEDLYKWLEVGNMPIFEDGDFLAYKSVRSDFTPWANGPFGKDQSPGKLVTMPRESCDSYRGNTCSTGLHFCSKEYLPKFYGTDSRSKIIALKINPKNVVAIPTDYNLTKGRCCEFYVLNEVHFDDIDEKFGSKYVVGDDDFYEDSDWDNGFEGITLEIVPTMVEAKERKLSSEYTIEEPTELISEFGLIAVNEVTKAAKGEMARKALKEHANVKAAAARSLGLAKSTFNDWLTY